MERKLEELFDLERRYTQLQSDHQKVVSEAEDLRRRLEQKTSENQTLRRDLDSANSKVQSMSMEMEDLRRKLQVALDEKRQLDMEVQRERSRANDLQQRLTNLETEFSLCKEKFEEQQRLIQKWVIEREELVSQYNQIEMLSEERRRQLDQKIILNSKLMMRLVLAYAEVDRIHRARAA